MATNDPDNRMRQDPTARLEQSLIEEFIRARGHDPAKLHDMAAADRDRLLKDAAAHASSKLAEMEARAHFVHELHGQE